MGWVKCYYLDASALVKLVVDEPDGKPLRAFIQRSTNLHATDLCVGEALGVLKGKWQRGAISEALYFAATRRLIIDAWGGRIKRDSVELFDPGKHAEVEAMAKKHSLDLSDALQLVTILKGTYSKLGPNSASVLITADAGLAKAAAAETIRAWNCIADLAPAWLET
jgi:predicted nucleic acid-binding protein